jgi:hypothetical protein
MPDVKFNVEAIGIPKVKSDLKSVVDMSKQSMLQIQQAQERHVQRMTELKQKLSQIDKNAGFAAVAAHQKQSQLIEQQEQRHQLRLKHMRERGVLGAQQGGGGGNGLNVIRHGLQAAGFYRTGHAFGALGSITGGQGIGIGAIAGAGALAVAITPVIIGLSLLAEATKITVGAFMGAVTELGKARNLQQMIVEAGENEKAGQLARLTVGAGERLSDAEMTKWASSMASNPAFGGSSSAEWRKAAGVLGTETGLQRSVLGNKRLMENLGNVGAIGGLSPDKTLGLFSSIYNQNRNLNQSQILDLIRSAVGIGREGQFNVSDLATGGGKVTSMAGTFFGGDYSSNVKSSLAYAAMVKGKTPGKSLEEAGTEASAFFRELQTPAHRAAAQALGVRFGQNGQILNPDQALAHIVANRGQAMNLIPALGGREAGPFMGHLATGIEGVNDQSTNKEVEQALLTQIQRYKELSLSEEQLNTESQENISSQTKLQSIFNHLADTLEKDFLKDLQELVPVIEDLSTTIIDNKDALKDMFQAIIKSLVALAPLLIGTAQGFLSLIKILSWTPPWASDDTSSAMYNFANEGQKALDKASELVGTVEANIAGQGSGAVLKKRAATPEEIAKMAQELHQRNTGTSGGVPTLDEQNQVERAAQIGVPLNAKKDTDNLDLIRKNLEEINQKTQKDRVSIVPVPARNDGGGGGGHGGAGDIYWILDQLGK